MSTCTLPQQHSDNERRSITTQILQKSVFNYRKLNRISHAKLFHGFGQFILDSFRLNKILTLVKVKSNAKIPPKTMYKKIKVK